MKTSFFTSVSPHNDIYNKRLKSIIMKGEKEYIEKQEILDAIRDGLLEIKRRRQNGEEGITLQQLIDEL